MQRSFAVLVALCAMSLGGALGENLSPCGTNVAALQACTSGANSSACNKTCGGGSFDQFVKSTVKLCKDDTTWMSVRATLQAKAVKLGCQLSSWLEPPKDSWVNVLIGVFMNMGGCLSNVIGLNLVRMAHEKMREKEHAKSPPGSPRGDEERGGAAESPPSATGLGETLSGGEDKGKCLAPIWYQWQFPIGWFLSVIMVAVLDGSSMGFAPLEVLAPLSGFSVLLNMIVAQKVNGEQLLPLDALVTAMIVPGVVLTVAYGPHQTFMQCLGSSMDPPVLEKWVDCDNLTGPFVLRQLLRPGFIVFEIVMFSLLGCAYTLANKMHVFVSTDGGKTGVYEINHVFRAVHPKLMKCSPAAYMLVAAIFAGHQMLMSKVSIECLVSTIHGNNQFATPLPYITIPLLIGFTSGQLSFMNRNLAIYGALQSVPLFCALFLLNVTLVSANFFESLSSLTLGSMLVFLSGISLVFGGVLCILKRPTPESTSPRKMEMSELGQGLQSEVNSTDNPMSAAGIGQSNGAGGEELSSKDPVAGTGAVAAPMRT